MPVIFFVFLPFFLRKTRCSRPVCGLPRQLPNRSQINPPKKRKRNMRNRARPLSVGSAILRESPHKPDMKKGQPEILADLIIRRYHQPNDAIISFIGLMFNDITIPRISHEPDAAELFISPKASPDRPSLVCRRWRRYTTNCSRRAIRIRGFPSPREALARLADPALPCFRDRRC